MLGLNVVASIPSFSQCSSPRLDEALYKSSLRDLRAGIDKYKRSQAFNAYVVRSENPHCDMGVVPPSVAAAFRTHIGVGSSLVCHGQDTVWELVVDIHYIGVQMRGGPGFSVGVEFVLGRAVFFVPMR